MVSESNFAPKESVGERERLLADIDDALVGGDSLAAGIEHINDPLLRRCRAALEASHAPVPRYSLAAMDERDTERAAGERAGMELAASLFDGFSYGPYRHPSITIRDAIAIKWPSPEAVKP